MRRRGTAGVCSARARSRDSAPARRRFTKSPVLDLAYSAFGALVFSFYIVYDTQRVVGGEHHSQQLNSRDWALGAMMLYMDMVNLFMFLMRLFGERE